MTRWALTILSTAAILLLPIGARAQSSSQSSSATTGQLGLRAGFGLDPDQFVIGAQVALGKKLGIARIVPSVDVGLGSSLTTIAFNGDAIFRLNVEDASFGFYAGAGAGLLYVDPESGASSAWKLGLNLIAGLRVPFKGLPPTSLEARFGVGDIPNFRGLLVLEL